MSPSPSDPAGPAKPKKPAGNEARWVRSIGKTWAIRLDVASGCTLAILGLLLLVSSPWHRQFWLPLVPALLFALIYPFARHAFFHRIVCPYCGYNPTRRKSDGEPRKDQFKVMAEISRLDVCPNCGRVGPKPLPGSRP